MGKILCATRGGEASYRTQDKAIALAQERGDELLFLYVADIRFLDKTHAPIVVDVEQEMVKMGEFLLLMAQERAAEQGVPASTLCLKGEMREELSKVARQEAVSLVVLGRPAGDESVFQLASLQTFANQLKDEIGVEAKIV
jgi:nucleotide-binding universal stress UspA family protein